MVSGGRCRRPGRAVGGQAEALARVRRGGRGIDAVFQSLRLLLIGLEGEGVLLGHLGGRRWRGGEAGSWGGNHTELLEVLGVRVRGEQSELLHFQEPRSQEARVRRLN